MLLKMLLLLLRTMCPVIPPLVLLHLWAMWWTIVYSSSWPPSVPLLPFSVDSFGELILVYPLSFMIRRECFEVYVRVCDVLVKGTMYFFFDEIRGRGGGGGGWVDWYIGGVVIYCLFIPYSFCTVGFVTIHFHIKLCCFINIHFIFRICWCLQSWYRIQVIEPLLRTRELRKRMFNTVLLPISDQELNPHSQACQCSIQTFKVGHWSGSKVFFFFFWGTAGQKKKI